MALAFAQTTQTDAPDVRYRPAANGGLACWLALPTNQASGKPPLVAVHGIRGDARQQADLFARRANALGRPVIAPHFDRDQWPRYQQAVRRGRADLALISLMDALAQNVIWTTPQFELFGFSGGAQFAHRFAMMHPHLVTRLTVASAGWYTFPDAMRFPYGLSARGSAPDPWATVTEDKIKHFLTIPTQVCVGADDTKRDANLRSGDQIDAQQGHNRLIRGIRWAQALQEAAQARGMAPRASFIALSGCEHDFGQCAMRGGLDRIVIPEDGSQRSSENHCGRDCSTCSQPCQAIGHMLRAVS